MTEGAEKSCPHALTANQNISRTMIMMGNAARSDRGSRYRGNDRALPCSRHSTAFIIWSLLYSQAISSEESA